MAGLDSSGLPARRKDWMMVTEINTRFKETCVIPQPSPQEGTGPAKQCCCIRVNGVVQGVGYRPFVWRLAHELALTGWVRNDAAGV